jgi:hypothetical protein
MHVLYSIGTLYIIPSQLNRRLFFSGIPYYGIYLTKEEIIKKINKTNQDNQSSAKFSSQIHCECNEPNLGEMGLIA